MIAVPIPSSDNASTLKISVNNPLIPTYSRLRVCVKTTLPKNPVSMAIDRAINATVVFRAEYSVLLFSVTAIPPVIFQKMIDSAESARMQTAAVL